MTLQELQDQGYELTKKEYLALHKEVTKELKTALYNSRKKLRKLYDKLEGVKPEDYFNEAVKFRRLEKLNSELEKAYMAAAKKSGEVIEESAKLGISNSFYRQQFALKLGSSLTDVNLTFTTLPNEVIETSVYGSLTAWQKMGEAAKRRYGDAKNYVPQSGTLLEAVLDDNRRKDLRKLRSAITKSLTNGEGYRKASKRVKDVFDTTATNALRIIRTEGHRNAMAGSLAMNSAAKDQGLGVRRQIVSVLDDRTRPQSAQVDGVIENEDGYFTYPGGVLVKNPGNSGVPGWDINDRESVINIIDGVEPTVRRARDPETGKTDLISWQSFDEWADSNGLKYNASGRLVRK